MDEGGIKAGREEKGKEGWRKKGGRKERKKGL